MPKLVNKQLLNLAVLKTTALQKRMRAVAETKLLNSKLELINDFKNHPVSKEIAGGASAANSSGTLGGYGNLYSFIGFNNNDSPIDKWVNFLDKKIKILRKTRERSLSGDNFIVEFQVSQVSESDYVSNAQMPWESGRSWLTSIERGISGFSNFISKQIGRSGGGAQTTNKIRNAQFRRVKYWSPMWAKFLKSLKEV